MIQSAKLVGRVLELGDRFVSLTEVAEHYRTSRQLVCIWRKRYPEFPIPIAEVRTGPIWLLSQFDGLKFGTEAGHRPGTNARYLR